PARAPSPSAQARGTGRWTKASSASAYPPEEPLLAQRQPGGIAPCIGKLVGGQTRSRDVRNDTSRSRGGQARNRRIPGTPNRTHERYCRECALTLGLQRGPFACKHLALGIDHLEVVHVSGAIAFVRKLCGSPGCRDGTGMLLRLARKGP